MHRPELTTMGWVQTTFLALLLVGSIHDPTASAKGEFSEEMAVQIHDEAAGIADEYEDLDLDIEKRDINPEMEDEEDGDIEKRQLSSSVIGDLRLVPAQPVLISPPYTIGSARKVSFDYSTNVDTIPDSLQFNATDGGLRFLDSSFGDEDSSEWSVVTPAGYEYDGSTAELNKLFISARLAPTAPGYKGDVSFSGEPDDDDGAILTSTIKPPLTFRPFTIRPPRTFRPFPPSTIRLSPPTIRPPTIGPPRFTARRESIARIQRSVFGVDTRVKVSKPYKFPWAAMGRIDSGCTGTFIGPRHILTAGHCVYSRKTKKWLKNLNFRRAKNCNPHSGSLYKWKWAITVKGWKKYGWQSYDYAMIVVDRPSPYYMSYGWKKPIPKWTVNIAGYPGDKPGRCMWRTHCKIRNRFTKRLGYRCDTYNGMSGSAVYAYWRSSNKRIIYCIHAYGKSFFKNYNKCTRITKARFNQFKSWIQNY